MENDPYSTYVFYEMFGDKLDRLRSGSEETTHPYTIHFQDDAGRTLKKIFISEDEYKVVSKLMEEADEQTKNVLNSIFTKILMESMIKPEKCTKKEEKKSEELPFFNKVFVYMCLAFIFFLFVLAVAGSCRTVA